jgi:hypothetical protein
MKVVIFANYLFQDHTGEKNQLWYLEIHPTEPDTVLIKNKESGKALAHQG